jgi:hypothetical protein
MEMGMPTAGRADVVVSLDGLTPTALICLRRLIDFPDPALNRLLVVAGPACAQALEDFSQSLPFVSIVRQPGESPPIAAWNRGLLERAGDVVLLPAGTVVSAGWLTELCTVALSEERVAFAWPLSNLNVLGSVPPGDDNSFTTIDKGVARNAFSGLPRSTNMPSAQGPCVFLRGRCIEAIGSLDPGFLTLESAIADWTMRAQALGFFGKRANRVFVEHEPGAVSANDEDAQFSRDRAVLEKRHPHLAHQLSVFHRTLDGQLPRHAVDFLRTGKMRVAFDIRHVVAGDEPVRTDAIKLATALAWSPEIDLTLLVNNPAQAEGFCAPLVTPAAWRDDFAIIHKPASFTAREELAIPYSSKAHVVVTVDQWTSRGAPASAGHGAVPDAEDTTRSLGLLCAQGILARTEHSRERIAEELGIPPGEIALVPREATADAVLRVYRSVVLNPSERSLQARRMLCDAILSWSRPSREPVRIDAAHPVPDGPTVGVRQAWQALSAALQRRLGREMRRLRAPIVRNRV